MATSSFFNDFYLADDEAVKEFFEGLKEAQENPPIFEESECDFDAESRRQILDIISSRYKN